MGFSTRLCVWAWLPHNRVAGFQQQASQESQMKHSAFYDLALKITWCHFHHILSSKAVTKVIKFQSQGIEIPPLKNNQDGIYIGVTIFGKFSVPQWVIAVLQNLTWKVS